MTRQQQQQLSDHPSVIEIMAIIRAAPEALRQNEGTMRAWLKMRFPDSDPIITGIATYCLRTAIKQEREEYLRKNSTNERKS